MKAIRIASPNINRLEIGAVRRVLKSGNLAQGPEVSAFEKEFSKIVEDRECVAVNSGTSALHLALLSLGIGKGDEVIVPSFTFAATANSVALTGATPVFVDVDSRTFCIDPRQIEKAITKKTRAIQVVHLYGLPADMQQILQLAKKHNLLVVEDAAQAHMASIANQRVGTFGDAAAFSFYPTKNMTSGEGGMIVFKDSKAARQARLLRNQGMEQRYKNEVIGFNLRMTDIHAAIGRVQLKKLPGATRARQENANFLTSKLSEFLETPYVPNAYSHVFHQYTIKVQRRDEIAESLRLAKIESGIYYPVPVHELPAFNEKKKLKVTSQMTSLVLSLPVHPGLTKRQLNTIVDSLKKATERL